MKFEDIEIEDVDFEAMLEESFKKSESKSDLVAGTVVKIDEKDEIAVIDIGGGRDATLSLDELKDEAGNVVFKVGDTIDVINMGRGRISHKAALGRVALKEFIAEYDDEQEYVIEGTITKANKGGYVVDCDGLEFFMPRTLSYLSSKTDPLGKKVKAVIVKVDKEKGSVVVSRKELIERDKSKTDEIVSELLENKNPVVGTIKKITSYGMFVDVGGMDGLVHYSQISHKGPVNPSKYFAEGDEVHVIALEYDKKKRHLSLSIKDANPDPWADIDSIIGVGDTVTATVSNIEPYGVFVDLGEDLEAFLHVSEISWDKNVKHPKDYLENNTEVNVEVIEVDKEGRRLRVSLKNLLPKPMDAFTSEYRVGDVVKGAVTSVTDFGAFVKVGTVEGLLHNQEISWDKAKNAKSELKVGDEVEVKIIKIDTDAGKISLSKKALEDSPVKAFAQNHKNGSIVTGVVKDKKDFGVFISLGDSIDALIRTEDLHPLKFDEIEKGQEITGVISFIDSNADKIRVSVKRLERQEEREAMDQINLEQNDSMTLGDAFGDKFKR
ncbi:MAG TPA: 30S ribosomal protein S1 [Sulfurovum sp.]|nr:MAG: 30S ribosomal protein S1 [Sulfurovum sp. 35-42-20]OYZ25444.1 MAG: 30S ribosomal protein S1 [Sulfurovum sp. 16-42-52]OZA45413.1 MAG: 30S ribosomal protein S1 [Sulfurovum sp. 17-42-90]OZA61069.1 MAG: 30S ribosomal protein S1 [Sulfurovum sp. 39-42-12]HQR74332.1 30S ribosomal protein S1 [Sulfurovum sp.]